MDIIIEISMKETLTLSGTMELSRTEVTQAIDYWLQTQRKMHVKRAIYVVGEGNSIKSAVLDVQQVIAEDKTIPEFSTAKVKEEEKQTRNMPEGFVRKNIGVFGNIREFIKDYRKQGKTNVDFEVLFQDIVFLHPSMDRERLVAYIRDKRQVKGIRYDRKTQKIAL